MANIKSADKISAKWARRAGSATIEYTEGIQSPKADWATQTGNAEKAYETGVNAAISRKSFGKGVKKTGTSGWQKNALEKGPARYQQGVQVAEDKYATAFKPYGDAIKGMTLPPRGPKGDPANINRVSAVATLLHNTKLKLQG
ncbi:MAG: hypothetical protein WAO71_05350 [Gallionella sp.]